MLPSKFDLVTGGGGTRLKNTLLFCRSLRLVVSEGFVAMENARAISSAPNTRLLRLSLRVKVFHVRDASVGTVEGVTWCERNELTRETKLLLHAAQLLQHEVGAVPIASVAGENQVRCFREPRMEQTVVAFYDALLSIQQLVQKENTCVSAFLGAHLTTL